MAAEFLDKLLIAMHHLPASFDLGFRRKPLAALAHRLEKRAGLQKPRVPWDTSFQEKESSWDTCPGRPVHLLAQIAVAKHSKMHERRGAFGKGVNFQPPMSSRRNRRKDLPAERGSMRHLVLIRHGESELNAINRERRVYCGQFETPLTARGREQARLAARRLQELDYLRVQSAVSSTLDRARETLQLILNELPAGINVLPPSPNLVERSHGLFEGKSEDEVFHEHPAYRDDPGLNRFMDHFHQHAPGGESLAVVADRVWRVIRELTESAGGDTIIVSHYNPIRCIVGRILNMPEDEILRLRVPNAIPIVLRWNGGFELVDWPATN